MNHGSLIRSNPFSQCIFLYWKTFTLSVPTYLPTYLPRYFSTLSYVTYLHLPFPLSFYGSIPAHLSLHLYIVSQSPFLSHSLTKSLTSKLLLRTVKFSPFPVIEHNHLIRPILRRFQFRESRRRSKMCWRQCDQIGRISKVLGHNFSSKNNPNIWWPILLLLKYSIASKNCSGCNRSCNLWQIWGTLVGSLSLNSFKLSCPV